MITSNVITLTLNGDETAVEFEKGYPYCFIRNDGSVTIHASLSPGITPEAEGVYAIPAGVEGRIGSGYALPKFYILGTGKVQIRGEQIATPPSFKRGGKGGDKPTPNEFDMSNIKAYFDVSGIDAENKIWTNAVDGGGDITFAEGSKVDDSLMIPGDNYGSFPLAQNPEVVYLVAKKPVLENDMCFFAQGSSVSSHGNGLEFFSGSNGYPFCFAVQFTPFIYINADKDKWHLFVVLRDWTYTSLSLCFCDTEYMGNLTSYNKYYTGDMYLGASVRSNQVMYMCKNPSYYKFIAAGGLPEGGINAVINNMNWIMQNIVNPANEEV